ncbi:MAG: F0F1 ATP synthase subunit B [bacterium]
MNLLSPDPGTIFWTALTFVLLLFVLKKMAWGPILQTLDERERRIKESLEKANVAQKELEEVRVQQQEILESAKKEAQELLNKSRKTAESTKDEIIQKAQSEASSMIDRAKREIVLESEKAVEMIKKQTVELSVLMASKLISKSLSSKEHKKLIEESLQEMVEAN